MKLLYGALALVCFVMSIGSFFQNDRQLSFQLVVLGMLASLRYDIIVIKERQETE